ncbi:hypothetical protein GCM10011613_22230 [Cellvibrio zantedeschiae]|uniref:3-keto-disaccharide hydrolase domain-containing protein n=1 Tax=Cellvibrio zantedeschiae TaxID=1237077 RepID=A0ABQ3B407_9GAMM|nr:hypothetical protein [Cellvibrio zantedeschiae]GGY77252.1 hypothetical protein GCM10011613_22230 [Cellvibrio zantedeschiae]
MTLRNIKLVFLCLVTLTAQAGTSLDENFIPFTKDSWNLEKAKIVNIDGRQAISGVAVLTGQTFENGIIEMELKTDGSRGFPGIIFREDGAGNGENIYLRPHNSGRHDAAQYAPDFNDQTGWQLYYGEGFTASPTIASNQWLTLRIEVKDSKARAFLNDMSSPILVTPTLKGKPGPGRILISDGGKGTYLANFRMKKTSDLNFPEIPPAPTIISGLPSWKISKAFPADDPGIKNLSFLDAKNIEWTQIELEPSGLANISRYLPLVKDKPSVVYAKTVLKSDKQKRIKLEFGYSDDVIIFHNRRAVYSGQASFRSREPSFYGLVGYNDAIYLDLNKGENEILLQLTENFGGWGFMMRSVPAE